MIIRTLVADDNADLVEALREVLGGDGSIQVVATAHNGADARRRWAELLPDVAILDIDMPGGGTELVRELCSGASAPRVLVFSARDEPDTVLAMLAGGATAYVAKGSLDGDFPELVRRCAAGETFVVAGCAEEVERRQSGRGSTSGVPMH